MHKNNVFLLPLLILMMFPQTIQAEEIKHWTSKSFNISEMGSTQWNWPDASKIEKFYPLGISKDGWFAHSSELDEPEISLLNLDCKEGCLSDSPLTDKCGCLFDAKPEDLEKIGIEPFNKSQKGTFPAGIQDDEYDIEIVYKEKAIYPIVMFPGKKSEPEFPGSYVYLVSKKMGRKEIGLIDHNHMCVLPGVRPLGWLKCPLSDRLIVFVLCGKDYEGTGQAKSHTIMPFGVHLK